MKDKFGYNVHYKKSWEAKRKTIIRIFSDWDESYQALPRWMNIVKLTNLQTKIVWKTSLLQVAMEMYVLCVCSGLLGHVLKDLSIVDQ